LRRDGAPRQEIRTAECDVFGAEETVTLARAAQDGRLEKTYQACLPAEILIIKVGRWKFVFWPGEIFTEYGLALKADYKDTYLISCSNGDTQTYIVTKEAADNDWYETFNAIFSYEAGEKMLEKTRQMLAKWSQ